MPEAFQVVPTLLLNAAGSVEDCCDQLESGRKSGAGAGVSSGLAGFAVTGACAEAGEASVAAFSGVARSWRAWAGGAVEYARSDESGVSALRGAVV